MDTACALAAGATCLSNVEAMTAQEEIFGPGGGSSDSTMLRALDELAERLGGDGLPGRRLARATAAGAGGPARRHLDRGYQPQGPGCGKLQGRVRLSPVDQLGHQHR
ncbi:MAG: hypothetical protein ACRDRQ_08090 [Pseudonocardiaceae bacterium]